MNKKWLILDCNYLCHRAKHSTGGLRYGDTPTGVIYGFLKSISYFQELFNTPHIVFCWDSKTSKREEIFPAYKAKRKDKYKDMSKSEIKFEIDFRKQMQLLRREYLPTIGYNNVFVQKGYEADDLIASVCLNLPMTDEAVIITSDKDLYQLIGHFVSFFNPVKGKILTMQGFKKKYGIRSYEWGRLKAIAGCNTDGVPGVKGVGEKTVIKYITLQLKETSKAYLSITSKEGYRIYKRNLKLVSLPFKGTKTFKLQNDLITQQGWNQVIEALGMKSLRDKAPIFKHRKG